MTNRLIVAISCLIGIAATRAVAQDTTRMHRMTPHDVKVCGEDTLTQTSCRDAAGNIWAPNPPVRHQYGPYEVAQHSGTTGKWALWYVWRDGMACMWLESAQSTGATIGLGCSDVDAPPKP
jgi:hypothetical protein